MFDRLFGKAETKVQSPAVRFDEAGIHYNSPAESTAQWLAMPYDYGDAADLGARLQQVFLEGLGSRLETEFLLPWADVYALLNHPELTNFRDALSIPAETEVRPRLTSRGALMDTDFGIFLDGWLDPTGRPMQPAPRLEGRVLKIGEQVHLLPGALNELLDELTRFHAYPAAERSLSFKEQAFGRMRKLAKVSGCAVSDYVDRTVVLTPERLRLAMSSRGEAEGRVVEVAPSFDEEPAQWLSLFDRLPLQDSYDVPDGASLVRVVVSPEVKSVLAEIKRMPGRRVAGPRAQAFVRNPYAILGGDAEAVIDQHEFEEARATAGIEFTRFTPHVERGDRGEVQRVALLVETLGSLGIPSEPTWIDSPADLAGFVDHLERCIQAGAQCVTWRGRELEIIGDSADHLALLQSWLREWSSPSLWTADEVLDLSHYSARIEDIGIEKSFVTPVIARNDSGHGWFEGNVAVGIRVEHGADAPPTILPVELVEIPSLEQAVNRAEKAGRPDVCLPGLQVPVPIKEARQAVEALKKAAQDLRRNKFVPEAAPGIGVAKKRLIIKRNLEDVDYNEFRAVALQMPDGAAARLPRCLKPEVALKPHQLVGVAWLQHLWDASPTQCRGTVLADDMGLGKTLQLLTFLASCFERDPSLPPALLVAPVALLDNWRSELERFFMPGALPLLTLYGDALARLRVGKHELDAELKQLGVTRLLKKNWIGGAKLVLTTYETMRDLEFALASQQWSVMVCDEAQKIKTPAAMVTRSAKKQKVRFRIACTGTPVENSLADLWCLFDYVQPGMLGALNQFSRTYRQPIEAKTPEQKARVEELRAIIQPQILHRKKTEVATDLPVPIEDTACKSLPMSTYQHGLYDAALRILNQERATNPAAQLQALMAIRQICSDPHGHAEPDTRAIAIQRLVHESPKLGWLVDRLKTLAGQPEQEHKVIIFCEFRELQLMLQRVVAAFFGFAPSIVNGDTSADPKSTEGRQKLIDAFQRKAGFNAIILSPLAVGFGVNIQAANHVVHFTRTWNPAKEDQATARAYRIGQSRVVTVYYPGVVSDKLVSFDVTLDKLLSKKRALASDMLNGCGDLKVADFAEVR
ncbi:DEAD/DEAH box helicase [Pelomonas sp. V22]|uniref:DEAD/DEAH box helicase n=1 Tax=Pelomonas sp. V22 TaxID=2822139 RepID=UPI0024A9932A|nr:DEAD/DEAH box helicase [Pelomonas sp. V22]MDI4634715.1 DEAD/DEAH box helicase [Pelomonas sp. V22]